MAPSPRPMSMAPLPAGAFVPLHDVPYAAAGVPARARTHARSVFLLCAYLLALPLWWLLGIDFAMPLALAAALLCVSPGVHGAFRASDFLLAALIAALASAAFLNGFLLGGHTMRFAAALYNLSLWVCGLILLQQARAAMLHHRGARRAILRAGFLSFLGFAAMAWGSFAAAFALDDRSLAMATPFGMTLGDFVPHSAALIRESTVATFTRPDWGLPGVPMPRVVVYGPYPTATAAVTAVLGSLALLYLHNRARASAITFLAAEGLILATLAITLTRSIIVGWLLGLVAAGLLFGTIWRRIACIGLIVLAIPLSLHVDFSDAAAYRGYSTESRFENYFYAMGRTLENNAVLGLGVKPREVDNHIAVGSHSTFISTFTKSGTVGLVLALAYLVLLPAGRWLRATAFLPSLSRPDKTELRILFNLQVALWMWLCFEDIDAPASAAMLVFLAFAFIEVGLQPRARHRVVVQPGA